MATFDKFTTEEDGYRISLDDFNAKYEAERSSI